MNPFFLDEIKYGDRKETFLIVLDANDNPVVYVKSIEQEIDHTYGRPYWTSTVDRQQFFRKSRADEWAPLKPGMIKPDHHIVIDPENGADEPCEPFVDETELVGSRVAVSFTIPSIFATVKNIEDGTITLAISIDDLKSIMQV